MRILPILLLVLLVVAAPAQADQRRGVATQLGTSTVAPAEDAADLDRAAALGADTVRVVLGWQALEPDASGRRPDDYVARIDRMLDGAAARGLAVIAVWAGTPCWASSAPAEVRGDCGPQERIAASVYPPASLDEYARATRWVVERWGGRLAALEVWNEPNNIPAFWRSPDPPADYSALLRRAFATVEAARPALPVLGGSLAQADGDYLEQLYAHGAGDAFDGLAVHPYQVRWDLRQWGPPDADWGLEQRGRSFEAGLRWLRSILDAHGDAAVGLWVTEFGYPACTGPLCASEPDQAAWLDRALRLAAGMPSVRALLIHQLRDDVATPIWFTNFGLLRHDGTPRPAFDRVKTALGELAR